MSVKPSSVLKTPILIHLSVIAALFSTTYAALAGCRQHKWMCDNGFCLDTAFVCDGEGDCNDGEDERKSLCGNCSENSFYCSATKKCMSYLFICDGVVNCPSREDEDTGRCFSGIIVPTPYPEISCNETTMTLRIHASSSKERYYMYNSKCMLSNDGSTHSGEFQLTECGLRRRVVNSTVIYYAYIVSVTDGEEIFDDETRPRQVECHYKADPKKTDIVSFEATIYNNSASSQPKLVGSPASNVTAVVLRQYPTGAYVNPYSESEYPVEVHLGATMYFQVKAIGDTSAIRLGIENCKAYSSDSGAEHYLMRDGCPINKSFQLLASPPGEVRFTVKAFTLLGSDGHIFMVCDTVVCDKGYGPCQECTSGAKYKRESRESSTTRKTSRVSLGPVHTVLL